MIQYFKYRAKLPKLFWEKEKLRVAYSTQIRAAKKDKKSASDIQSIEYQLAF